MMSCPLPLPLPLLPPALHVDFPPVHIGVKRGLNLFERGSDELLSQAAVMAPASDNNNQDLATKKAKLDSTNTVIGMGITKTSRVVHIRNIPNEVSEVEIMQLGMPFGRVTNVLVLKGKNQAFIEMMDENAASQMVTAFHATPPFLRGRTVYVQYSNHRELKIDQNHAIANVTNALQAQDLTQSPTGSPLPLAIDHTNSNSHSASTNNTNNSTTTPSSGGGGGGGGGAPNTVLRVIVESLLYPVSLDVLHQIFQRFGKVLKIVTFTKNNSFQALIQYPDAQTAQAAKQSLDGQNIYNGCCTLRIDNSKLTALNVKYNNDKSRDYTNPSLPSGEPGSDVIASAGGLVSASDLLLLAAGQRPQLARDRLVKLDKSPYFLVNGLATPGVMPPFGLGIGTPALASAYGGALPSLNAFALASNGALGTPNPANVRGLSNVLLVSNLNDEMVTPDALFTLFAMTHLDKLRIWNKTIRVMPSKHQAVQLPKEGQPDAGLTRDYAQNPLHRFKKPGSKNYQNIYPPSATLHLSNIPATVTEDEIKEAFTKNSFEVKAFKFFPKDHKMALIQLSSIEEAVCALIKMHNYQLSESNHLRVSFSKSNI
ncbi:polypyrimidine tract-binding protein 3 isoform X6 [Anopheles ziemanni]|uniref:polypyrimidine tract-binding protein 3 isoform X6 n=1 Tax=Anopheles coustani TaxID=139045 RepID=UPI002659BFB2|nr:polypyrimidine tract-binding protein 3 isoform X6 [Anopheles coustani]XP_058173794.1 polypyrimidine tract-binding protein 3 isoform X6 [Anopheles ziemanni]